MEDEKNLSDDNRTKLDGIVKSMISNNETDSYIQSVVDDFKGKYTVKKKDTGGIPYSTSEESLEEDSKDKPWPLNQPDTILSEKQPQESTQDEVLSEKNGLVESQPLPEKPASSDVVKKKEEFSIYSKEQAQQLRNSATLTVPKNETYDDQAARIVAELPRKQEAEAQIQAHSPEGKAIYDELESIVGDTKFEYFTDATTKQNIKEILMKKYGNFNERAIDEILGTYEYNNKQESFYNKGNEAYQINADATFNTLSSLGDVSTLNLTPEQKKAEIKKIRVSQVSTDIDKSISEIFSDDEQKKADLIKQARNDYKSDSSTTPQEKLDKAKKAWIGAGFNEDEFDGWLDLETGYRNKGKLATETDKQVNGSIDEYRKTPQAQLADIVKKNFITLKGLETERDKVKAQIIKQREDFVKDKANEFPPTIFPSSEQSDVIDALEGRLDALSGNLDNQSEVNSAKHQYEAAARAYYLNRDPEKYAGTSFSDFMKSMAKGFVTEFAGQEIAEDIVGSTDVDLQTGLKETTQANDFKLSPEESDALTTTFGEKVAPVTGSLVGVGLKFGAMALMENWVGVSAGLQALATGSKLKRMLGFGAKMVVEDIKFQALFNAEPGEGALFTAGMTGVNKALPFLKLVQGEKWYKQWAKEVAKTDIALTGTGNIMKFYNSAKQTILNDKEFQYELEKNFGATRSEAFDNLMVEVITNPIFAASGIFKAATGGKKALMNNVKDLSKEFRKMGMNEEANEMFRNWKELRLAKGSIGFPETTEMVSRESAKKPLRKLVQALDNDGFPKLATKVIGVIDAIDKGKGNADNLRYEVEKAIKPLAKEYELLKRKRDELDLDISDAIDIVEGKLNINEIAPEYKDKTQTIADNIVNNLTEKDRKQLDEVKTIEGKLQLVKKILGDDITNKSKKAPEPKQKVLPEGPKAEPKVEPDSKPEVPTSEKVDIVKEVVARDPIKKEETKELKDIENTTKALEEFVEKYVNTDVDVAKHSEWFRLIHDFKGQEGYIVDGVAKAYHKAKADGSDPELVKAVENLLTKESAPEINQPKTEDIIFTTKNKRQRIVKTKDGQVKVVDSDGKEVSKSVRSKTLTDYRKNHDFNQGETSIEKMEADNIVPNDGESMNELVVQYSNNPSEILNELSKQPIHVPPEEVEAIEEAIEEAMSPIKQSSFIRFGDRNKITNSIAKSYFAKKGDVTAQGIDQIAQAATSQMNDTEVTTEQVIDFILKYQNGSKGLFTQPNPRYQELHNRFVEVTGITASRALIERYSDKSMAVQERLKEEAAVRNAEMESIENTSLTEEQWNELLEEQGDEELIEQKKLDDEKKSNKDGKGKSGDESDGNSPKDQPDGKRDKEEPSKKDESASEQEKSIIGKEKDLLGDDILPEYMTPVEYSNELIVGDDILIKGINAPDFIASYRGKDKDDHIVVFDIKRGDQFTIKNKNRILENVSQNKVVSEATPEQIKYAYDNGLYKEWVEEGRMTQADVDVILKSANIDKVTKKEVKPLRQGAGHTKGTFVDSDGQVYKSVWTLGQKQMEKGKLTRGKSFRTAEYEVLKGLQDMKHVPKVGKLVETNEGEMFEIETLNEIEAGTLTLDELRKIETILDELVERKVDYADIQSFMRRDNGEIVLVDFSVASANVKYPLIPNLIESSYEGLLSPKDLVIWKKEAEAAREAKFADIWKDHKEKKAKKVEEKTLAQLKEEIKPLKQALGKVQRLYDRLKDKLENDPRHGGKGQVNDKNEIEGSDVIDFGGDKDAKLMVQDAKKDLDAIRAQIKKVQDEIDRLDVIGKGQGSLFSFTSPTEDALPFIKQAKGSPDQMKAMLLKNGAKQAELDWVGWDDFAKGKKSLSKEDIQEWIDDNKVVLEETVLGEPSADEIATLLEDEVGQDMTEEEAREYLKTDEGKAKFADYQTPGGKNYKEWLLTIEGGKSTLPPGYFVTNIADIYYVRDAKGNTVASSGGHAQAIVNALEVINKDNTQYIGGHFDEPNIVAHTRTNERTDVDGDNVLHVEEFQADIAARIRELETKKAKGSLSKTGQQELNKLLKVTPFQKTPQWVGLALKRMVQEAAEKGFDKVTWTTGEQQVERYNLSKKYKHVEVTRYADGKYGVSAATESNPLAVNQGGMTRDDVVRYIGEKATSESFKVLHKKEKIRNPITHRLSDLKVGGEGMEAFYDQILPSVANKLFKKYGVKVEKTTINSDKEYDVEDYENFPPDATAIFEKHEDDGHAIVKDLTKAGYDVKSGLSGDVYSFSKKGVNEAIEVHSLKLTPKLIKAATGGFPMFSKAAKPTGNKPKGKWNNKAKAEVSKIAKELGVEVTVVNKESELPTLVQGDIKRARGEGKVPGLLNLRTGKIYIVLDNNKTLESVRRTVVHEAVGHKGLIAALGKKKYNQVMDAIYNQMTPKERKKIEDDGYDPKDTKNIAEEYLAQKAPDAKKPTWLQKIFSEIKDLLRKLFGIKYSENDFNNLFAKSKEALKKQTKKAPKQTSKKESKFSMAGPEDAGFREGERKDKTDNVSGFKGLELPEYVQLIKKLTGRYPTVRKNLRGALGRFSYHDGIPNSGKIALLKALFDIKKDADEQDIALIEMVIAHEIGHLIDSLPKGKIKRGNILGHISASEEVYRKSLLGKDSKNRDVLTPKDRARLNREAARQLKDEWDATAEEIITEIIETEPIYAESGLTVDDILKIWRDTESRTKYPDLYEYITTLNSSQKAKIMRKAMRGIVDEVMAGKFNKRVVGTKETRRQVITNKDGKYEKDVVAIRKRYQELLADEIKKRQLFFKETIMQELKDLTRWWHPFNESKNQAYTDYRHKPEELYADALSVLLNSPHELEKRAPEFKRAFFNWFDVRKDAQQAYNEIQELITDGKVSSTRKANIHKDFAEGARKRINAAQERVKQARVWPVVMNSLVTRNYELLTKLNTKLSLGEQLTQKQKVRNKIEQMSYIKEISAVFLKEINDNIITKSVKNGINISDLGELAMYNRNINPTDRGKLANPHGMQALFAKRSMADIAELYSPEQVKLMNELLKNFHDQVWTHMVAAHKAGIISDRVWEDKFIPNKNTYVTYQNIEYITNEKVKAITPTSKGTLASIENPLYSTVGKVMAFIQLTKSQEAWNAVKLAIDEHVPGAINKVNIKQGRVPYAAKGNAIMSVYEKGELVFYEVPEWVATVFKYPAMNKNLRVLFTYIIPFIPFKRFFNPAVTTYNPGWWLYSNLIRDNARSMLNVSTILSNYTDISPRKLALMPFVNYLPAFFKGFHTGYKYAKGDWNDQIKQLLKEGSLFGDAYDRFDVESGDDLLKPILISLGMIDKKGKLRAKVEGWDNPAMLNIYNGLANVLKYSSFPLKGMKFLGTVFEVSSKFAGREVLEKYMKDPEALAFFTRNYISTPNGRDKGEFTTAVDNMIPFQNMITQSLRTGAEMGGSKKTAKSYWILQLMTAALPGIYMGLMGSMMYLLRAFYTQEEIEADPLMKKAYDYSVQYNKVSFYDKLNYLIYIRGTTDDGDPIYSRIQLGEEQKLVYSMFQWATESIITGDIIGYKNIINLGVGLTPTISPLIEIGGGWKKYVLDQKSPIDSYYGNKVVPDANMLAGIKSSLPYMAKWTMDKAGLRPVVKMIWKDKLKEHTEEYRVNNMPYLSRVTKVGGAGEREINVWTATQTTKKEAKAVLWLKDRTLEEVGKLRKEGDVDDIAVRKNMAVDIALEFMTEFDSDLLELSKAQRIVNTYMDLSVSGLYHNIITPMIFRSTKERIAILLWNRKWKSPQEMDQLMDYMLTRGIISKDFYGKYLIEESSIFNPKSNKDLPPKAKPLNDDPDFGDFEDGFAKEPDFGDK